jgi:hypothetical protein
MAEADAQAWEEQFKRSAESSVHVPPRSPGCMSGAERAVVSASIQAFQLGESGGGSFLLRAAERRAERRGDFPYVSALKLFVAEEQRHARDLGYFMQQEGIPARPTHWTNTAFRMIRKMMGIELCIVTLLTAELIAMSYYRALGRATNAPFLRALCRKILRDEASHIRFQSSMLRQLRRHRPRWIVAVELGLQRALLLLTLWAVWSGHRRVFTAGGYTLARVNRESQQWLSRS